jgi:SHS2 domain-containing protein
MAACGFQEVEHTADRALLVWGRTFVSLCRCAAEGMLHLAGLRPKDATGEWLTMEVRADDPEGLLVGWLEELLFAVETNGVTFTDFDLDLVSSSVLVARVRVVPAFPPEKPIKAVTYHQLAILKTARGFETTIVFDV